MMNEELKMKEIKLERKIITRVEVEEKIDKIITQYPTDKGAAMTLANGVISQYFLSNDLNWINELVTRVHRETRY